MTPPSRYTIARSVKDNHCTRNQFTAVQLATMATTRPQDAQFHARDTPFAPLMFMALAYGGGSSLNIHEENLCGFFTRPVSKVRGLIRQIGTSCLPINTLRRTCPSPPRTPHRLTFGL